MPQIIRNRRFKGIRKDCKQWQEGSYVRKDDTTYCFSEDYERHPDNTKHYIAYDRSSDWGLPNSHLMAEVYGNTVCEVVDGIIGDNGCYLYEHDIVDIIADKYVFYGYELIYSKRLCCWTAVDTGKKQQYQQLPKQIRLDSFWTFKYCGNTCERENGDYA